MIFEFATTEKLNISVCKFWKNISARQALHDRLILLFTFFNGIAINRI
jgi:hypothetical protein